MPCNLMSSKAELSFAAWERVNILTTTTRILDELFLGDKKSDMCQQHNVSVSVLIKTKQNGR